MGVVTPDSIEDGMHYSEDAKMGSSHFSSWKEKCLSYACDSWKLDKGCFGDP